MVLFLRVTTYLTLLLLGTSAFSQSVSDTLTPPAQLDLLDLAGRWFGFKLVPGSDTEPHKPQWAVLPSLNFQPATGLAAGAILTTAFYPKDTPRTRLSTGTFYVGYSQFNQIITLAISNIWTKDHRFNLQGDWRFYNFPTTTYGLGAQTQLANASLIDYSHIRFHQTVYKAIGRDYMVGLGYLLDRYFDVVNSSPTGQITDFVRYGLNRQSTSSGVVAGLLRDRRGNPNNPVSGSYLLTQYRFYPTELGSSSSYQAVLLDYRRYVPLGGRLEKQLAFWSFNWLTFGGYTPYLDLPTTGWDTFNNSGRGYALGRLRGPSLYYAEAEYRTQLSANGLLGGVLFANAQAIGPWPNGTPAGLETAVHLCSRKIWPGIGSGLRLKLNKSARTNLAIDYGIGAGGSRGLYFNLNEAF